MPVALIGYGALGRQIEAMVAETQLIDPTTTIYFDDNAHRAGAERTLPFAAYASDEFKTHRFYVCLGYKHLAIKHQILERMSALARDVPALVHPASYVHPSVRLGAGVIVYAGCTVDRGTTLGDGVVLNNGDLVPHDCVIGSCSWLGVGVTLSGNVTVGSRTFIGSGAVITNDVEIGSDAIIGLATAVTRSVGDGVSVIGNPMRVLARPLTLT